MTPLQIFQRSRLVLTGAFAAALLLPASAQAARIVDAVVATPSLAGADSIDATDWMAESFALASTSTIAGIAVQVLDAVPASDAGQSFVLAIYRNVAGLPGLDFNAVDQGRLYTTSVGYTADGWSGATGLQWQLPAGSYFLAVEATSDPTAVTSLNLPVGAQPAPMAVAFYSGGRSYASTVDSDAFGLRIDTVAAVPEPSVAGLMLAGLGLFALVARFPRIGRFVRAGRWAESPPRESLR